MPAARKTSPKRKRKLTPDTPRDSVLAAVRRDLEDLAGRDPRLAEGSLAASALALAAALDDPANSATSKSMCARALRESIDRLWELAPPPQTKDGIDDLASRRSKRRATTPTRSAAATN